MSAALTNNELEQLLNFVGYGKLTAKVWFLGMEEAGGGESNIRARLRFQPVEDCANAHRILEITKHHCGKPVIQRTWRGMCYIMLRLDGKEPTRESIRNYQANCLGRDDGSSLLCELMPIPKPSLNDWGYEALIPQFSSCNEYYRRVKPRRIEYLHRLLSEQKPELVVCYGKKYWQEYKELFAGLTFVAAGRFLVARATGQVVVLTDHFAARTMNGKFDEVVDLASNASP